MDPLRIALLTSRSVPGIGRLLHDPNRGSVWNLTIIVDEDLDRIDADYVLVAGYPYDISPLLSRFEGRVLAIHEDAGDFETRSSVSIAGGPLFLLGPPYPLAPMALDARERGDIAFLESYAALHRTWMITTSWPDMLARTMELLAAGTIQIIGDVVWIDGAPGPCRFGESPRACHEPEAMLARGIPRSCPFIE